jgi:hypothetical protein
MQRSGVGITLPCWMGGKGTMTSEGGGGSFELLEHADMKDILDAGIGKGELSLLQLSDPDGCAMM